MTKQSSLSCNPALLGCSLAGILVSLYAYHVETSAESDGDYVAYCDINEAVSCTKVLSSRYGRGFGILGLLLAEDSYFNQPNSVFGIFFYLLQIFLERNSTFARAKLQTLTSICANVGTIYLASLLYFVLQIFCVVCVSVYLLNAIILYCNIRKMMALGPRNSRCTKQRKIK